MFHLHSGLCCCAGWPPSTSTCFAPVAAAHADTAAGRSTRRHYQHNVLWCGTPIYRAVANTVNTRVDHRNDCHADDCLLYSTYNGDVHSSGKHPICSLCRWRRHASCCCCTHYLYRGVVWVNITSARNPKLSYSRQTLPDAWHCLWLSDSADVPAELHAVNFKRLHAHWCVGWTGWHGDRHPIML